MAKICRVITGDSHEGLRRDFPLAMDTLRENQLKRDNVYDRARQMLKRLAEEEEAPDIEEEIDLPHQGFFQMGESSASITWDLSYDQSAEDLPNKIASVLRIA